MDPKLLKKELSNFEELLKNLTMNLFFFSKKIPKQFKYREIQENIFNGIK